MRGGFHGSTPPPDEGGGAHASFRATMRTLLPYLWEYRGRAALALVSLVLAKVANVGVPLVLKDIVDALNGKAHALVVVPVALLTAYGILRVSNALFGELRDVVFARVTRRAVRRAALRVFKHLHALPLQFHLGRQTGAVARDIERGSRGIAMLLNFFVFNIAPTLVEIALVTSILLVKFRPIFTITTIGTLLVYVAFTLIVTEWRTVFRRFMNDMDSRANSQAVDSLLNYETVKYFGNEEYEVGRYDAFLEKWENAAVRNQVSLAFLNVGQSLIIAAGATMLMVLAAQGVANHTMSLGDLVLVNAFLIQLYTPLHFLGFVYREIRHALVDMDRMFSLLKEPLTVADKPDAPALAVTEGRVRFEHVGFFYHPERPLLTDIDFEIPPRSTVAIVGPSGAGKSTLVRLLVRLYDPTAGRVTIDGQDLRDITQKSLRHILGVVPQEPVLFNDTLYANIAYGRPDAPRTEVEEAARLAHLDSFVRSLPDGYQTRVGERGLKLSGGEKQRVAIARALLKDPRVLLFDEATSALDAASERVVQEGLALLAPNRSTLVIAHRLATIQHADQILVMVGGRIVERGRHRDLVTAGGAYAHLWTLQQETPHPALAEPNNLKPAQPLPQQ